MYIIDSHCDSIERLDESLVCKHNFSSKYPQLQFVAMFVCHDGEDGDAFEKYAVTGASANAYTSFDRTCYLFSCSERFY